MKHETKKIIEKIFKLRDAGLDDAIIAETLDLKVDVAHFIDDYEREKDLLTVKQAADMLKEVLGEQKEKFNYHKVLRLIKSDEIKADEKLSNKEGIRIHITEIENFIENRKLTLHDWKLRALQAESRVLELEAELLQLKNQQSSN